MPHDKQQAEELPTELWLTPSVFARIQETIGARKAESGGMLGGNRETGEVTGFYFDEAALEQSSGAYSPNHTLLTRVLKDEWKPRGIQLLGFVHSHPPNYTHLSPWDKDYARTILESMDLPYLLLPIIRTAADTDTFTLFPYLAKRGGNGIEIVKQGLRVGDKASTSVKLVQADRGSCVYIRGAVKEVGLVAIDLTATGIALVQLARTHRRRYQQKRGENDHAQ